MLFSGTSSDIEIVSRRRSRHNSPLHRSLAVDAALVPKHSRRRTHAARHKVRHKNVQEITKVVFFHVLSKNIQKQVNTLSKSFPFKVKTVPSSWVPSCRVQWPVCSCLRAADTLRGQCAQSDMTDPNQIASVDLAAAHQNACHTAPHYGQKHPKAKKFSEMSPRSKNLLRVSFAILLLSWGQLNERPAMMRILSSKKQTPNSPKQISRTSKADLLKVPTQKCWFTFGSTFSPSPHTGRKIWEQPSLIAWYPLNPGSLLHAITYFHLFCQNAMAMHLHGLMWLMAILSSLQCSPSYQLLKSLDLVIFLGSSPDMMGIRDGEILVDGPSSPSLDRLDHLDSPRFLWEKHSSRGIPLEPLQVTVILVL